MDTAVPQVGGDDAVSRPARQTAGRQSNGRAIARESVKKGGKTKKLVISESGIFSPKEMLALAKLGVGAFLVGTSIMLSDDIEVKVRELSSVLR